MKQTVKHHTNKSVKKFAGGGFAGGFAEGYAGSKSSQKSRKKNKLFSFGDDSGKDDRTLPEVEPISVEEPDPERFGG